MVWTIAVALTPIAIPAIAYTNAVLAVFILSGLPAEVRKRMPATIIIIVPKAPTSAPTACVIFNNNCVKLLTPLKGFGITTAAETKLAKPNKIRRAAKEIIFLFIPGSEISASSSEFHVNTLIFV